MIHDPFSQVVDPFGGAMDEVLALQSYEMDDAAVAACLSTISCNSSPSCRSNASCLSTFSLPAAEPVGPAEPAGR